MDKSILLDKTIQAFIIAHEDDDSASLMLQRDKYPDWPLKEIVDQIVSRKKAKNKIPLWYNTKDILYPKPVSIEQSSSEIAAVFKAKIVRGKKAIDLTGGYGVDSFYLAKQFKQLTYVEPNTKLTQVAAHNFSALGQNNIQVINSTAEKFLSEMQEGYDLIYIDPDRRPEQERVWGFNESSPDILKILPELKKKSKNILIKASPMLDIHLGLEQLEDVAEVIVLSIDNEVKELLFLVSNIRKPTIVRCINIKKGEEEVFDYIYDDHLQENCKNSILSEYLCVPNASIMKAGAFKQLCTCFNTQKLNPNTNLFTSESFIENFPGRIFRVIGESEYKKEAVQKLLNENKANISVRNFMHTPEQVKKKLNLQDGGLQYLFAYRNIENKPRVAVCERLV